MQIFFQISKLLNLNNHIFIMARHSGDRDESAMRILRLLLILILAILVLSLIANVLGLILSGPLASIVILIILIVAILWFLSPDGQRYAKNFIEGK